MVMEENKRKNVWYYIKKGSSYLYYYLIANWLFLIKKYNKKYINSKWFRDGKYRFMSSGWRWVVIDNRQCRRAHVNLEAKYPVNAGCIISGNPANLHFHPDELNNLQGTGCYFQTFGNITIGKGVYIACNVGIITANHKINDLDKHEMARDVIIGDYSWIGMNSIILPGVVLGAHTIVGAGSVVTHSFEEGNCVVAGNPAKMIKKGDIY